MEPNLNPSNSTELEPEFCEAHLDRCKVKISAVKLGLCQRCLSGKPINRLELLGDEKEPDFKARKRKASQKYNAANYVRRPRMPKVVPPEVLARRKAERQKYQDDYRERNREKLRKKKREFRAKEKGKQAAEMDAMRPVAGPAPGDNHPEMPSDHGRTDACQSAP